MSPVPQQQSSRSILGDSSGVMSRYTVDVLIGSTLTSSYVTRTVFEAISLQPFTNYIFEVQV